MAPSSPSRGSSAAKASTVCLRSRSHFAYSTAGVGMSTGRTWAACAYHAPARSLPARFRPAA